LVDPNKKLTHLEDNQTNNRGKKQTQAAAFARAAVDLDFGVAYIP